MKLIRRVALTAMLVGVFINIVGLIKHPGIPYQDPTAEMLLKYDTEAKQAELIQLYGLCIFIVSFGVFIIFKVINYINRQNREPKSK